MVKSTFAGHSLCSSHSSSPLPCPASLPGSNVPAGLAWSWEQPVLFGTAGADLETWWIQQHRNVGVLQKQELIASPLAFMQSLHVWYYKVSFNKNFFIRKDSSLRQKKRIITTGGGLVGKLESKNSYWLVMTSYKEGCTALQSSWMTFGTKPAYTLIKEQVIQKIPVFLQRAGREGTQRQSQTDQSPVIPGSTLDSKTR